MRILYNYKLCTHGRALAICIDTSYFGVCVCDTNNDHHSAWPAADRSLAAALPQTTTNPRNPVHKCKYTNSVHGDFVANIENARRRRANARAMVYANYMHSPQNRVHALLRTP